MENLRVVNNHPVHILNEKRSLSPTAFIPFCSFGGDMRIMGTTIEQFEVPVCNSFKTKIRNDQLCYQIDLEEFKDTNNIEKQLKDGLVLVVDYNEERQMPKQSKNKETNLMSDDQNSIQIHLETISKNYIYFLIIQIIFCFSRPCYIIWRRAI